MQQDDQWREILLECIVHGMLFKALAHDAELVGQDQIPFKMSYRSLLEEASIWAERKHHEYRRMFTRLGGTIRIQRKQDDFIYYVLVTIKGYQQECVFNVEILRAECQARLDEWIKR